MRHSYLAVMALLVGLQTGCGMAAGAAPPREPSGSSMASPAAPPAEPMADAPASANFEKAEASDERLAAAGPVAPAPPPPPPQGAPSTTPAKKDSKEATDQAPRDSSKIVYTATITMAVYQVQPNLAAVERIAKEEGGYLAIRNDSRITVRVPRARFEQALAQIEKIGDVLHRDVTAEDVTDQYTDLEIRIKNARAMQTRLKQLLEKAAVKEAIEIEKELARVTQELELLEGKITLLKDKIAYSTITVAFEGRGASLPGASKVRLPFPWLSQLGLVNLLQLREERAR